eukprot:Pgem_evm1s18118
MELNLEGYFSQLRHLDWYFKLFNRHLDTLFFFEQSKKIIKKYIDSNDGFK